MEMIQRDIQLKPRSRGFHLITREIEEALPELRGWETGMAFLLLRHTSASLSLNENADPDVRTDMEFLMNRIVPEGLPGYVHTLEGRDDMPAHGKSALLGASLNLPVKNGRFHLGTWQGIYLCEHRDRAGARNLTVTLLGQRSPQESRRPEKR